MAGKVDISLVKVKREKEKIFHREKPLAPANFLTFNAFRRLLMFAHRIYTQQRTRSLALCVVMKSFISENFQNLISEPSRAARAF